MKIIITNNGLSRVLEGDFELTMGRGDVLQLVTQLREYLADTTWGHRRMQFCDPKPKEPVKFGAPKSWLE